MSEILILRVVHIGFGVLWAGGFFVMVLFIEPITRAMGPDGGKFMAKFAGSKFPIVMMASAIVTILAGLRLYQLLYTTVGWAPQNATAKAIMLGAAAAIVTMVLGITISRPSAARMSALAEEVQKAGGKPTDAQAGEIVRVRARLITAARVQAALVAFTVLLMASARYLN